MSVRIQALAPTARVTNARPVLLSDARTETAFVSDHELISYS